MKKTSPYLRQHRIIIVVRLRRQIFRQVVQIERRRAGARQAKFVQDDGKDASKRRVSRRRRSAKVLTVNCAVLPYIYRIISALIGVNLSPLTVCSVSVSMKPSL